MISEGIFINGEKVTFNPENILNGDVSAYTEAIGEATQDWLDEHLEPGGSVPIDDTLSISGAAADAKKTGDEISELKEDLTQKANIDGSYEDLVSGGAYQIISNMEEVDNTPYNYRTAGGSLEIGDREKLKKIVGGSLAVNQCAKDYSSNNYKNNSNLAVSESGGVITATMVGGHALLYTNRNSAVVINKDDIFFLEMRNVNASNLTTNYKLGIATVEGASATTIELVVNKNYVLTKCSNSDGIVGPSVYFPSSVANDTFTFGGFQLFNLTKMFGATIANYIYSLETATAGAGVAWLKAHFPKIFDAGYIPYNAGTLEHVSGLSAHKMTGFNQLDLDSYMETLGISKTGDYYEENANVFMTKSVAMPFPIRFAKGQCYTFTLTGKCSANLTNFRIHIYYTDGTHAEKIMCSSTAESTTTVVSALGKDIDNVNFTFGSGGNEKFYLKSLCVSLHWDGERDGEYEPYEEHSYPLDSDMTLRGIPKLDANNNLYYDGDEYTPDGTVTRNFANKVFVGAAIGEYWFLQSINEHDIANFGFGLSPDKYITGVSFETIVRSNWYGDKVQTTAIANTSEEGLLFASGDTFYVRVSKSKASTVDEFKAYLAEHPLEIVYKLATPTTEEADPYTEIQNVSNWGTEEFVTTSLVPVGHETAYQPDFRAKIEVAPESPDTDGLYLMKRENGQNSYVAYLGELPSDPTTDGTYTLKCTVASGTATKTWEADT